MNEFDFDVNRSVFLSKTNFSTYIENIILENPGMTHFEAILKFSEESDKEPEDLLQYMSTVLLEKVKQSAIDANLIRNETYSLNELL